MALEYLREYRTYFHLCRSYGLSESACYRSCRWVEDILIKIGSLKRFKIVSDRYRNRRKRFGLRFNLIAGIYNYEVM